MGLKKGLKGGFKEGGFKEGGFKEGFKEGFTPFLISNAYYY